ncbi:hypothetical protein ACFLQ0_02150 [Nitrospinota bacterium]
MVVHVDAQCKKPFILSGRFQWCGKSTPARREKKNPRSPLRATKSRAEAARLTPSFNGPHPRLRADTSHLFFVTAKESLSLFIVHDKPNDEDGGDLRRMLSAEIS